ncbi:MAG: radical SAM protein [Methanophagales archaeon]|nr:radical SAM protein [Methanophagales archaeon]
MECPLIKHGFEQGSCQVFDFQVGRWQKACESTLKYKDGVPYRLINAIFLSRPEHYLSIYQSGCNLACKKCHSWHFTQNAVGEWMSPYDMAKEVEKYLSDYKITFVSREHATSWHAHELCIGCGSCVMYGKRSKRCPGIVDVDKIELSPQGWGPARNIVAFTGGDLACQPAFYAKSAELIKELNERVWVLFETNGYGLTPGNLDLFKESGIDSLWLDIKAFDEDTHRKLTSVSNSRILKLPAELKEKGFVFEVLSLYIPGWVETAQIAKIATELASVDAEIPFTILAFFPAYQMRDVPSPNMWQMLDAYNAAKDAGLRKIRLGNVHLFVNTREEYEILEKFVGRESL